MYIHLCKYAWHAQYIGVNDIATQTNLVIRYSLTVFFAGTFGVLIFEISLNYYNASSEIWMKFFMKEIKKAIIKMYGFIKFDY